MNKIKTLLIYLLNLPLYWISKLIPKDKNIWVFGAWFGERYADNSKYLFEYVNKYHPEIIAVWLTNNRDVYKSLKKKGYRVFMKKSFIGLWIAIKAKVAVVCQSKREDLYPFICDKKTIVVQLWHGIPLKKIGYDDTLYSYRHKKFKFERIKKIIFPFLEENYTLFISTCEETKKIFARAFNVDSEKVKVTGYPRNDCLLLKKTQSKGSIIKVIYLPTFRKDRGEEIDLFEPYGFSVEKLDFVLKELNAEIYMKLHPVNKISRKTLNQIQSSNRIKFLESYIDLYEILNEFDVLITDYSSVYFDYLLTDKPIIFAPFDLEDYLKKDREFYYEYDKVTPGPKARNWYEVLHFLKEAIENPDKYKEEREKIRNIFHKYQDGRSSERVFNEIIKLVF